MQPRRNGFTLIETVAVGATVLLVGTVLATAMSGMAENARSAKCRNNLKRVMNAVQAYTVDHNGFLPGPLHPAIIRGAHNMGDLSGDHGALNELDKKKSLGWLLRPYFPPVGDSATNPSTPNPIVDEIMRCPTASVIAPDEDFYDAGAVLRRPYNYAINSYGPLCCPMTQSRGKWFHTDPPFYFGCWYYLDQWPETPGIWWNSYRQRMWKPKPLAQIKFPSAEWAVGDAWYRRIPVGAGRVPVIRREVLGTFPAGWSGQPLPSAPYHRVPLRQARSTRNSAGSGVLPGIDFDGETNQAYFDGHVGPFRGNWRTLGDGGTVSPYWAKWGGEHTSYPCP